MIFKADLHIHSCLSPCAESEMTPRAIACRAAELGLDLIALTDHNSALNCPAFAAACLEFGRAALYGAEAATRENVHLLCLFGRLDKALEFGERLFASLPETGEGELPSGQYCVSAGDIVIGKAAKFLGAATGFSVEDLAGMTAELEGLLVPAHVDRPCHSMMSRFGSVPDGPYAAIEVTEYPPGIGPSRYAVITNSDAHALADVGRGSFLVDAACPVLETDARGNLLPRSYQAIRDALAAGDVLLEV
jgi:3',5'-nucleoside bisphosphate phosphatase